jgi:hypothetical protein
MKAIVHRSSCDAVASGSLHMLTAEIGTLSPSTAAQHRGSYGRVERTLNGTVLKDWT